MTILKKKGKWQFGYKDTYSLDSSLGPIICAGLKKFHDVLEFRSKSGEAFGIPGEYVQWGDNDVGYWLNDLKKMMYAFENKEPAIEDYDFEMRFGNDHQSSISCTNEEGYALYRKDIQIHQDKVQEGLTLFALRYKDLWW